MKKILLIGDSISLDYGKYLSEFVSENIRLYGKPGKNEAYTNLDVPIGGNGGDSSMVLQYVKELDEDGKLSYDYFIFNCGLHDIKHNRPENKLQIDENSYAENLKEIIEIMDKNSVKVIFINTTPADELRYNDEFPFIRYSNDVILYNNIAEKIMCERGIHIINLYSFTLALKLKGDDLFRDHTHFTDKAIRMQAAYIAGELNSLER